ncbi:coiled-coil domain-containing protein 80-like isoform X3 [Narcine bancroftii]|uniref:coiled-coil domain-containing protein 80-like isoform X3 n=1 Tax=Narcine bancroftii TaxID=1343680 RepID=UPI0038315CB5
MGARCRPLSPCLLLLSLLRAGSGVGTELPPDPLARHFGKARLLVIAAPGPWDASYRLMQQQLDLSDAALRCELARRDLQVLLLFQSTRPSQGKWVRVSRDGEAVQEKLRAEGAKQLVRTLALDARFAMVLLKKSLQVFERFPYAVRMEAVLDAVDQMPLRKVESLTRRTSQLKCQGSRAGSPSARLHRARGLVNRTGSIRPATTGRGVTRSQVAGGEPPLRPTTLAPGERWRGKQGARVSSQGSDDQRKAKPPRSPPRTRGSPAAPSQTAADHLRGRIRQRVAAGALPRQRLGSPVSGPGRDARRSRLHGGSGPIPRRRDGGGPGRATAPGSDLSAAASQPAQGSASSPAPRPGGEGTAGAPESPQMLQPSPASPRGKGSRQGGGSQPRPPKKGKGESEGRRNRKRRKNRKQGSRKKSGGRQLLAQFRSGRRLLVITAPSKDSRLYVQQRDDYLEHVCQLAIRHISVVIVLGSPTNSTLIIEHYQTENEPLLENPEPVPVSADLIGFLRKEFGMSFNEFFMVLIDYDMKVKQFFDVPIPIKVLVDYMDTFPSRLPEIQEEKRNGITCLQREGRVNINKLLARLQGKRRLLIISTPYEEEWTFQQQILALNGQECNLGIRHFAVLKLMGSGEEASGSLDLFPANGRSRAQREKLSSSAVNALRKHFQVTEEHFMMLLVGKDGAIASWYLSPVWSLATIYDQVDSTQLRQDEMKLHEALGIHCHDEEHSPSSQSYPQHG